MLNGPLSCKSASGRLNMPNVTAKYGLAVVTRLRQKKKTNKDTIYDVTFQKFH